MSSGSEVGSSLFKKREREREEENDASSQFVKWEERLEERDLEERAKSEDRE